jgi:hypothetical protein
LSITDTINTLPSGSKWAIQCFDSSNDGLRIAQAIRTGTAVTLSDGSFKDGFGTVALILEAEDPAHNIVTVNVVPGNTQAQGSYRSELAGIFGQIIFINLICQIHGITQGAITSRCDGKGALTKVFSDDDEADTNDSQFDLLSATRSALKASPITWHFHHVKGHQDEDINAVLD